MTPDEWDACTEPQKMLLFLRESGGASERKLRLYACACCREVWAFLGGESQCAVAVAERYADGLSGEAEREAASAALPLLPPNPGERIARRLGVEACQALAVASAVGRGCRLSATGRAAAAATASADLAAYAVGYSVDRGQDAGARLEGRVYKAEMRQRSALARDLFGSPFRPLLLDPSWLTPEVLSLAKASYEERIMPQGHLDPQRLAVLADALEEVGCADEGILGHLRSAGPHVRGCHVVDAVLGRE
jgi:hypothetical protein